MTRETKTHKKLLAEQAFASKALDRIYEFVINFNPTDDTSDISCRAENLERLWDKFSSVTEELSALDYDNENMLIEVETKYYQTKSTIKRLIDKSTPKNSQISSNYSTETPPPVKLPTIILPTFNGDYTDWVAFKDAFFSLIHNNKSLSNDQKMQYLKASLKGEASDLVESLRVTSDNYPIACELLTKRYDKKRIIVQNHVKSLCNLISMKHENVAELKRLLTDFMKNIRSLQSMGFYKDDFDFFTTQLLSSKFDFNTLKAWEETLNGNEIPSLKQLEEFVLHRIDILNITKNTHGNSEIRLSNYSKNKSQSASSYVANSNVNIPQNDARSKKPSSCFACESMDHLIYTCPKFTKLNVEDRIRFVKNKKLCINCLRGNHDISNCKSSGCRVCNKNHNTFLHKDTTTINSHIKDNGKKILLATAIVQVKSSYNHTTNARCLLDSGSHTNFITENLVQLLHLRKTKINSNVSVLGTANVNIKYSTTAVIKSKFNHFQYQLDFLVLPKITDPLPLNNIDTTTWNIPKDLNLADPSFNVSKPIDLLIGAELFDELILNDKLKIDQSIPSLRNTQLGWIVSGKYYARNDSPTSCLLASTQADINLHDQIQQFWELENNVTITPVISKEEQITEEFFQSTTKREFDGRFIVQLPFKQQPETLGESKQIAIKQFYNLEHRLQKTPAIYSAYRNFMNEYITSGHMKEILPDNNEKSYYLPHHAVIREESLTTKLRVVFNGSCKTTSGLSLNDILYTGGRTQNELYDILIRFRTHKFVLMADVKQMFRMIWVEPEQTNFQRIVWRNNPSEKLKHYNLRTVTYGTACAPFLATRTLNQLAIDSLSTHPIASKVILNDFYVDDLITGCDDLEKLITLRDQLSHILSSGGFELRKWCSNHSEALKNMTTSSDPTQVIDISGLEDIRVKTLGLNWYPTSDTFKFFLNLDNSLPKTKRSILSETARIYDPLGLIGPVTVIAKQFMQELWLLQLNWDEEVPADFLQRWIFYREGLINLGELEIPRFINSKGTASMYELHGFCDASIKGYGACLYLRSTDELGNVSVRLITSRSRVAPLKRVTLPRLELCGALLLAQLYRRVASVIDISVDKAYLWTDSTIVISWLSLEPSKWKTFVGNRTAQIQELTRNCSWCHVRSEDNPADVLSRGCTPRELKTNLQWWTGPKWLTMPSSEWPQRVIEVTHHDLEARKSVTLMTVSTHDFEFSRFSSWIKITRVYAYVLRFIDRCKKNLTDKLSNHLSISEINRAETLCFQAIQREAFNTEIQTILQGKEIDRKSHILSLKPFLDENNLLRVGGRLEHSYLAYDQQHPVILPKHYVTELIVRQLHNDNLHPGANSLLAIVRLRFWPINGKSICNSIVHKCIQCYKMRPKPAKQLMAPLPEDRITAPSRPFSTTGVDYAGPILIKTSKRRNAPSTKGYICLFICFATRALHIEAVTGLDTDSFIAALRRFISRRGLCAKIYCDNGLNFVGAKNKLNCLYQLLNSPVHQEKVQNFVIQQKIEFHFIPPLSPHFGGLWEAGVKSVKSHLLKVMSHTKLTFEELYTLLTQIECILNSRPLLPLPSNQDDLLYLTPSHFLIGSPPIALPDEDTKNISVSRLDRWRQIQRMVQHFWSVWSKNYLSTLQPRSKWKERQPDLKVGNLVMVKDDNQPPLSWIIGRIQQLHPGADGHPRVATIQTSQGFLKRPIVKLCLLPVHDN